MKIERKKLPRIITTTVATCLIIFGTVVLVAYSRGYRINNQQGSVQITGVLNVESDPMRTTIYIDGNEVGKSPKTVSSLQKGFHKVVVTRDGYHDWSSEIDIKPEKSTPLFPHLFLTEPEIENVFSIDEEVYEVSTIPGSGYIFITTTRDLVSTDQEDAPSYTKIWRFNTNPRFWDTSQNPSLVYESDTPSGVKIEVEYSSTGEYGLLYVHTPTEDPEVNSTEVYLLDTSAQNPSPKLLDLTDYYGEYEFEWADNDTHLLLESEKEVVSYDISSGKKTLMAQKTPTTVWALDDEGNFYYSKEIPETTDEPAHTQVMQTPLSGGGAEIFIDKVFSTDNADLLISQNELLDREEPYTFRNSPNASQFVGIVNRFHVLPDVNLVLIATDKAFYAYDLETDKYTLLSPKQGNYIDLSSDEKRLLFTSDGSLYLYTFDKEEANHTKEIGVERLKSSEGMEDIAWHRNSRTVLYREGEEIKTIDINGENNLTLFKSDYPLFVLDEPGENIFVIDESVVPNSIQRLKIN